MPAKETHESPARKTFEELARELDVDEDESHFEDAVRKIAKATVPKDRAEDGMDARGPWFYRRPVFSSVMLWPANLMGVAWFVFAVLATVAAGSALGMIAGVIGIATFFIVAFIKSEEPPPHW